MAQVKKNQNSDDNNGASIQGIGTSVTEQITQKVDGLNLEVSVSEYLIIKTNDFVDWTDSRLNKS